MQVRALARRQEQSEPSCPSLRPGVVAQRICRSAAIVGRERVLAGSDCGFGSFAGYGKSGPRNRVEEAGGDGGRRDHRVGAIVAAIAELTKRCSRSGKERVDRRNGPRRRRGDPRRRPTSCPDSIRTTCSAERKRCGSNFGDGDGAVPIGLGDQGRVRAEAPARGRDQPIERDLFVAAPRRLRFQRARVYGGAASPSADGHGHRAQACSVVRGCRFDIGELSGIDVGRRSKLRHGCY